ncbi:(deoxy)nucleoside triphosphate pyrophosphohydrolase [Geovibrio thiophilus]|uniref:8-oxo-dGTP diphosphatase n=1 Tax=Geovibrio thiophilus TaxID=139438 RepID=A0A3R5Y5Q6_9BACT|nr:(deoxy)nucleoside triphosphate pyrophosphohydrolase [Geovibrio thiophilus]QAR32335.1 (deoxy)nucleoside triphosphate pyrophosphohydrolase [Geovibrio thiophilus]
MTDVAAAVIFKDNKVFLARRGAAQRLGGFWEFPGGKIEQGESGAEAIIREIKEELGINVQVGGLIGQCVHHYDTWSIRLIVYECDWISGRLVPRVHDDTAWVGADELASYSLAPADVHFVEPVRAIMLSRA